MRVEKVEREALEKGAQKAFPTLLAPKIEAKVGIGVNDTFEEFEKMIFDRSAEVCLR